MIQEIITYMIIGAAVALTVKKAFKKFGRKKKRPQKTDFKNETFSLGHNCADCAADCMLRDATKTLRQNSGEICKKIDIG